MGLQKGETCDAVAIKSTGGPPALIDGKSQVEYKKEFEKHRLHATGKFDSEFSMLLKLVMNECIPSHPHAMALTSRVVRSICRG